ncbi:MAG: NAD(P)-dependent oxidoreductase [Candidatus Omnitrophota bacterium]|nr:NAD(P)-dependent oxidoreductase [Candidatus Omnitrophota bacterium]
MMSDKHGATVLLTGNGGYIGTVMTRYLNTKYRVIGLDSGYYEESLLFPVVDGEKPYKQITKDLRDVVEDDLDGVDTVIHLAGLSNDPLGDLNPELTDQINCGATVKLARAAKKKGAKRFIFSSSCSIYGLSEKDVPVKEEGEINPLTAYAKAKVDAELALMALADENFHPVLMRNATVYGLSPKLRLDLVVNNLLAWAYLTGEIAIMSDGTPWRPIIHVRDLCDAFMAVLEEPAEKMGRQVFNVGLDGENYQVRDIAYKIKKFLPEARVTILNKTGADERSYRVDFSKIRRMAPGFKPLWGLEKGIEELLGAYKKHRLSIEDFESDKFFRIRTVKSLIKSGKVDEKLRRSV